MASTESASKPPGPITDKELDEVDALLHPRKKGRFPPYIAISHDYAPRLVADLRAARALLREWLNEHREGNCEASMLTRVEAALPPED